MGAPSASTQPPRLSRGTQGVPSPSLSGFLSGSGTYFSSPPGLGTRATRCLTPPCITDTHLSQAKSLASTTRVCSSKEKKNRITSTCSNHSDFSPSPPPSPPLQPPRRQDPGLGMGQERCKRWPAPSRAARVARSAAHAWGRDEHVNEPVPARGE